MEKHAPGSKGATAAAYFKKKAMAEKMYTSPTERVVQSMPIGRI